MRIGVLEWASCGGAQGSAQLTASIKREGWAMCRAMLTSLQHAGHDAVATVRPELLSPSEADIANNHSAHLIALDGKADVREQWQSVYSTCDHTIVIAPECNGILLDLNQWCRRHAIKSCHSGRNFVRRAGDKLATAQALDRDQIPHPATRRLSQVTERWLQRATDALRCVDGAEPIWVLKPRDGVGCEGIKRLTANKLTAVRDKKLRLQQASSWIVQPWLAGKAYSRAAIVDSNGAIHWLPVARQHLSTVGQMQYRGGSLEPQLASELPGLDDFLNRAIRSLRGQPRGWIGIDFLWNPSSPVAPLTVIEINPRLTTSFVGLCAGGAPDLAGCLVAAARGEPFHLPQAWEPVVFTSAGGIQARTG